MEVFLAGVLPGSHATRQRHLRQAKFIYAEIAERWHRGTPWSWQRKHLAWFLKHSRHTQRSKSVLLPTDCAAARSSARETMDI